MPAANFDLLARPYRWLEYLTFGPFLERCRCAQLERLAGARRALVLGDGDGRFLERLLAANPHLAADVVDSSRSMLRQLDRRIPPQARSRIRLHHADALSWTPTGSYDLVVTHFFLDCFFRSQIEQLLDRILPHLAPQARWLISEFAIPPRAPVHTLSQGVIGLLYRAFGLLTGLPVRALPDYAASFRGRNLAPLHEDCFLGGLLASQIWSIPCRIPATARML